MLGNEDTWDEMRKVFAHFINLALNLDHDKRPSAEKMVTHPFIDPSADSAAEVIEKIVEHWLPADKAHEVKVAAETAAAEKVAAEKAVAEKAAADRRAEYLRKQAAAEEAAELRARGEGGQGQDSPRGGGEEVKPVDSYSLGHVLGV